MERDDKSGLDEVKKDLRKIREELEDIKKMITESESCLMHFFYFGTLAAGLPGGALFATGSFDVPFIFLYAFGIILWLRFWLYDTRKPGLKCKTESVKKIKESIFYFLALAFSFLLAMVFWFASQPLFYMAVLAIMYAIKASWHWYHKKAFEKTTEQNKLLHLAYLSDFIIAFVLAIFSLIFLADIHIFPLMSLPPFLEMDPISYSFRSVSVIFLIGITAGLELHYYMIAQMLKTTGYYSADHVSIRSHI